MPLVKVAANQGAEAIRRRDADGVLAHEAGGDDRLDLVIIGGVSAGLAAAIACRVRSRGTGGGS